MADHPTDIVVPLALLARRLRVPAAWLREEADAGRIPHLRARSKLLFNPEAVENALARRAAQRVEVPHERR